MISAPAATYPTSDFNQPSAEPLMRLPTPSAFPLKRSRKTNPQISPIGSSTPVQGSPSFSRFSFSMTFTYETPSSNAPVAKPQRPRSLPLVRDQKSLFLLSVPNRS